MKKQFGSLFLVLVLSVAVFPATAQNDADSCSRYQLNPENAWNDFKSDLEEGGIPLDLWGNLVNGQGVQLEDYGITSEELGAFFEANRDRISNLLDNNPLRPYIDRALGIMGNYGLGEADIEPLLAVRDDMKALFAALGERGLSSDRADAFLSEIAPVVREASDKGLLKYSAVGELDAALKQVNGTLTTEFLRQFWNNLDDFEQLMLNSGENPEAVRALMESVNAFKESNRINERLLRNFEIESDKTLLSKYGVPSIALREFVGEDKSDEDIARCLAEMGFEDAELLSGLFGDFDDITLDDLNAFYAEELAEFLALSGLSFEDLGELYGMDDDELLAFLRDMYDESYADWLFGWLRNSDILALSALGLLDDDLFNLAFALYEDFDDNDLALLLGDYTFGALFDQLIGLDDEAFAALFDDPDAFDAWFSEIFGNSDDSAVDEGGEDGAATSDNSSGHGGESSSDDQNSDDSGSHGGSEGSDGNDGEDDGNDG